MRIHKEYIDLEVEEFNTPSSADVARILGLNASSPLCNLIVENLSNIMISPPMPGLIDYLIPPYDRIEILDPSPVEYRISESSLRDLQHRLFRWSVNDLCFRSNYPPESHQAFLDSFLLGYARRDPPLTMVSEMLTYLLQIMS